MTTNQKKILLLGVGNMLFSDEGVGVHAANYLEQHYDFSDNVTLVEGGVMGKLLMPALLDCDEAIIMDAVLGGQNPGAIYRLENEALRGSLGFRDSQHQVDLVDTLICCELIGKKPEAVVIGMEPADWKTLRTNLTPICEESLPKFIGHVLDELTARGGTATKKEAV